MKLYICNVFTFIYIQTLGYFIYTAFYCLTDLIKCVKYLVYEQPLNAASFREESEEETRYGNRREDTVRPADNTRGEEREARVEEQDVPRPPGRSLGVNGGELR